MDLLQLIGRQKPLFLEDLEMFGESLNNQVSGASFLVLGGAGSIGQAVVKEIFKRKPSKLHVVDISENNLAELVRDIRSSLGYIKGNFKTYALDIGSWQYDVFITQDNRYDYVLNLSALKHVRSEKDPFTLMRMIEVNILNTIKTIQHTQAAKGKKYFAVSTDKAANPVNMMGASKRIMELFLMRESSHITTSTARFANVAFSDGSLLYSFNKRLQKRQPIVAPNDVKRYFVTPEEAGQLCLFSCLLGENREIYFPKLSQELHLTTFSSIAVKFLEDNGFEPYICESEDEARSKMSLIVPQGKWPCLFSKSDTTGEKPFEEFYTLNEELNLSKFKDLGIIKSSLDFDPNLLEKFENKIAKFKSDKSWNKSKIVSLFKELLPSFEHVDMGKYLDEKM
jgi:nucleoside-diphosphate-sugar epimerase